MSCGSPGTSQLINYYAKQFGLSRSEVSQIFHWLKAEHQYVLREIGEDPNLSLGLEHSKSWLLNQQRLMGKDVDELTGPQLERLKRIYKGEMSLKAVEVDTFRMLPGVLAIRKHAKCPICQQYVGKPQHRCPSRNKPKSSIKHWPLGPINAAYWWKKQSADERTALIYRYPYRVGGLDGVPAKDRDLANRILLAMEKRRWTEALESANNPETSAVYSRLSPSAKNTLVAEATARLEIINSVEETLQAYPDSKLLVLETTPSPGKAAIASSNIDEADHIAILVPGMNSFVKDKMLNLTVDSVALKQTSDFYSRLFGDKDNIATVAWIGYHAPGLDPSVAFTRKAKRGAKSLKNFVRGIRLLRFDSRRDVHVTLIGHSYGSVVSGFAARDNMEINELVIIGSPGVPVKDAKGFEAREGHVWAAAAKGDHIANFGWFGPPPTGRKFKSRVIRTEGGEDPLTKVELESARNHSEYYKSKSFSLRNLALITLGKYGHIVMEQDNTSKIKSAERYEYPGEDFDRHGGLVVGSTRKRKSTSSDKGKVKVASSAGKEK